MHISWHQGIIVLRIGRSSNIGVTWLCLVSVLRIVLQTLIQLPLSMLINLRLHQAPTRPHFRLPIFDALAGGILHDQVLAQKVLHVAFFKCSTVVEALPEAHLTRAIHFASERPCGAGISLEGVWVVSLLVFL